MTSRFLPRRPLTHAVGIALAAMALAPPVFAQSLDVSDGATHDVSGQTFDTGTTASAHALEVTNAPTRIQGTSVVVRTGGANAMGILASGGGTVDLADVDVATAGANAMGVYADTSSGLMVVRNGRIATQGSRADGVFSRTVGGATSVALTDTTIATTASDAFGIFSMSGGISLTRGSVTSVGAALRALDDGSGLASITTTDVALRSDGSDVLLAENGGAITLNGGSVDAIAAGAAGASITNAGSTLAANGTTITSAQSTGVRLIDGGVGTLVDTTVTGADNAVSFKSATAASSALTVSGGLLQSAGSAVIAKTGTHALTVSNGAQLQGGNNTLVEVLAGAGLTTVFDGVDLVGTLTAAPTGVLDLTLRNNASLNGVIANGGATSVESGASWILSGDSDVASLALGGTAGFAEPGGGVFKTLTVHGDYAGNDGTLALNTHLAADDAGTDRLVVEGNTSGTTNVAITNVGGAGVQTTADGIQVVRVDGASAGTFALAGRAVGGAYEYTLHQGGVADPNDGDWYLRSALAPAAPVDPGTPVVPVYRPETGVYLANQAMATTLFRHRRDDRGTLHRTAGDTPGHNAWVRLTRSEFNARAGEGQIDIGADSHGMELGSQFAHWTTGMGAFAVGALFNKADVDTHDVSQPTQYRAIGEVQGSAATVFGTWFADPTAQLGPSIDAWVQRDRYEHTVRGEGLVPEAYIAHSWSASVEGGYAFAIHEAPGASMYLEPQLQFIVTDYDMRAHTEANGTVVAPHDDGGLTTRVGVRLFGVVQQVQPFLELNAWHNDTGNALAFDGRVLALELDNVAIEGNAGLAVDFGKGWSGWGSLGVQHASKSQTVQGQMGLKYHW